MKIGRILILLALILVLGVGAAFLWLQKQSAAGEGSGNGQPTPQPTQQMLPVVIAAQPIRRGMRITDDLLAVVDLPADRVIATQLTDPKQAIGKLAVRDLAQGMFLTQADVAEKLAVSSEGSLASLQVPPGYVAISIPMTRLSGVAYGLRPGDHVAVLASFPFVDVDQEYQTVLPNKVSAVSMLTPDGQPSITANITSPEGQQGGENGGPARPAACEPACEGRDFADELLNIPFYVMPSEAQRARLVSQMLIKDAVVLYVGTFPLTDQQMMPTPQPTNTGQEEETPEGNQQQQQQQPPPQPVPQGPQVPPDIITLVVSPQEAVTLKYLMDRQVTMTLALRAGGDTTDISTEAVTLSYVLGTYGVVVPAKLPYDINPGLDKVVPPVLQNDNMIMMPAR